MGCVGAVGIVGGGGGIRRGPRGLRCRWAPGDWRALHVGGCRRCWEHVVSLGCRARAGSCGRKLVHGRCASLPPGRPVRRRRHLLSLARWWPSAAGLTGPYINILSAGHLCAMLVGRCCGTQSGGGGAPGVMRGRCLYPSGGGGLRRGAPYNRVYAPGGGWINLKGPWGALFSHTRALRPGGD